MRVGTFNLDKRPLKGRRLELLLQQNCDVWLLTEVRPDSRIPGFHVQASQGVMKPLGEHWAAVLSRQPIVPLLPDPHPASVAARVGEFTFCSTVLPWRGAKSEAPWVGKKHVEKTENVLHCLLEVLPRSGVVWGGDWNHGLLGKEWAGSPGGRDYLLKAIEVLELKVPTDELMAQKDICHAIDHIAVPKDWEVRSKERVRADDLSDHDAYVVEVDDVTS